MIRKLTYTAFLASVCLGLFAQELTDEQVRERRRRASDQLITKVIDYPSAPNDSSIHVNRDSQYQTMSPEALLQNVFAKAGACVSIENVRTRVYGWDTGTGASLGNNGTVWTSNGSGGGPGTGPRGLAYFHKGDSDFPMTEGLVMSTGDVHFVEGPNVSDSQLGSGSSFLGDADLQNLINGFPVSGAVTNVTVIEFDFIPTGSTVEFKYIFGSEEYPEFANSSYNDVFGFFVKPKNSASSPVNIAKLPATDNPPWDIISINNVNNGYWEDFTYASRGGVSGDQLIPRNSRFFVPQPKDTRATELDGYVYDTLEGKALVASFSGMTPCATYTMKLAIGNASDAGLGSVVFLEANSLIMGTDVVVYGNGYEDADRIYKGCDNNYLRITNTEPVAITLNLAYSGVLTNGTDYMQSNGTPLPTTVIIPANSYSDIYFKASSSAQVGQYFDIAQLCPCDPSGNTVSSSTRVYVYGETEPSVTVAKTVGVTTGTITVTATGSSGTYEYSIDNGVTWVDTNVFTGLPINTTYQVKTRDKWSCHEVIRTVSLSNTIPYIPVNPHLRGHYGN